jgi:hypothetical protein
MRRHLCGERFGARGRGSLPRFRDGTGPRPRLLGTGARSSLTERLRLTKSAARVEKSPHWSAARRLPPQGGRKARGAKRRSGPLVF